MDFFGLSFYTAAGIVNFGTLYGTELFFRAREATGEMIASEPFTNDIYETEGGYSASMTRRNPRTFAFTVQVLDAQTIGKLDLIHSMVMDGARPRFTLKNGYLLANNAANTLFNAPISFDCTIDYGVMAARDIRQAIGHTWKRGQSFTIRESITLIRPTAGDIVIVPGGSGN